VQGSLLTDHAIIIEMLSNAGYTVVSIDYRLAPETKLKNIIEDLRDALNWVRKEGPILFNIVQNRIGVVGNSAGGFLTLMSGFAVDYRPKALVSLYGYGDIAGDWAINPSTFYCNQPLVSESIACIVYF
jgi:acetyl esterase/lipase